MKRIEILTDANVIVEYHLSEQAANTRVEALRKLYPTANISVKPVVKHVELKKQPQLSLVKYTDVK